MCKRNIPIRYENNRLIWISASPTYYVKGVSSISFNSKISVADLDPGNPGDNSDVYKKKFSS